MRIAGLFVFNLAAKLIMLFSPQPLLPMGLSTQKPVSVYLPAEYVPIILLLVCQESLIFAVRKV
jgi:hypothetical protein